MKYLPDVLLVSGAVLVAYGTWLAYPPLGFIVLGGALILTGLKVSE